MENVVEVKNLVKRYKERVALDHLNLEIRKGEIFGLLGPNGSGKTTAINCILSLLQYDKGEICVMGRPMEENAYDRKRKIGVVMQNVAVFDELTVYENIDYFCGLYIEDKEKRKQCVEEAIEFVELSEFRRYYPKKLSGGLLRRLNIACGIAHKPELIFFDEPTVAVDPQSRNKILEGTQMLNEQGATIIYTSHYMEEVEQICSRIAILDRGKVLAQGTADELKAMIKNTETIRLEVPQISEDILQVIFDNLILNSVQQNENTQKLMITISINETNGFLNIKYCDNGKGLNDKYKTDPMKILEVHETTRTNGHGLGMWIVNNTCTMSGGEIQKICGEKGFEIEFTIGGKI